MSCTQSFLFGNVLRFCSCPASKARNARSKASKQRQQESSSSSPLGSRGYCGAQSLRAIEGSIFESQAERSREQQDLHRQIDGVSGTSYNHKRSTDDCKESNIADYLFDSDTEPTHCINEREYEGVGIGDRGTWKQQSHPRGNKKRKKGYLTFTNGKPVSKAYMKKRRSRTKTRRTLQQQFLRFWRSTRRTAWPTATTPRECFQTK